MANFMHTEEFEQTLADAEDLQWVSTEIADARSFSEASVEEAVMVVDHVCNPNS